MPLGRHSGAFHPASAGFKKQGGQHYGTDETKHTSK